MRPYAALLALAPVLALAEPGTVDWERKVVRCTGTGAPNLKDAQGNVAVARIGAERAARLDALRNCMEAVKSVRLSAGSTVGEALGADAGLKAKVEGMVRGFKVIDKPRYFSDGGVEMDVEVPLDGVSEALLPEGAAPTPAGAAAPADGATGLLVDARGTGVLPALAPRLLDEQGRQLYAADMVELGARKKNGAAAYARDPEAARKQLASRLGGKPRVVRAVRAIGPDLVIPDAEAEALLRGPPAFLAEGRVVIVTD
jgi:hypothetical protein